MKPREKCIAHGPEKLTSWELIAIILWSGTKKHSVFQIAKKAAKVVAEKGEHITVSDISAIEGIGNAKATQIVSAFELAKRHYITDDVRIESVQDILSQVSQYAQKKQEYLLCLTLDGAKRLIQNHIVTIGLLDQSLAHPREIFAHAIEDRAHSIVLVHNHPSGSLEPSSADISTTARVHQVGKLVGIHVLDHIIIGKWWHFSFRQNALLS